MAKRIDPAQQYSKRLSKLTSWFWVIYSILVIAVMIARPEAAEYAMLAGLPVHIIMVVNLGTYMHNSIREKEIYAYEFVSDWLSKYTGKGLTFQSGSNDEAGGEG